MADVARRTSAAGPVDGQERGQEGDSWAIPLEGERAPDGSVEEALRKLAHCAPDSPQLVANLAHNLEREFEDPYGWKDWQLDWAPDFPIHLVVRVLKFVRRSSPGTRERLRVHLISLGQQAVWRQERRPGVAAKRDPRLLRPA